MKRAALVVLALAVLTAVAVRWRNARLLAALEGIPQTVRPPLTDHDRAKAVEGARAMAFLPYDPFMGTHGDPLKPWGFVVCIDVPLRAYRAAGVPLAEMLKESAQEHPDWFEISPSNSPKDPFFYRRVRNYNDLFRRHPDLQAAKRPRAGDLAFFGRTHIALVTEVLPDGSWRAVEATPRVWGVKESGSEYLTGQWGAPAFFGRLL